MATQVCNMIVVPLNPLRFTAFQTSATQTYVVGNA